MEPIHLMAPIGYRIDDGDAIVAVSDSWAAFAVANEAPHLLDQVLGRSLWEFVSGETTRQVYRDLLELVRGGRTVTFSYRCDSPSTLRFMRMTMSPAMKAGVAFDSVTIGTMRRSRPFAAAPADEQSAVLLRRCSMCKRIGVGDEWDELDVAVERLAFFAGGRPPTLAHTICQRCFARIVCEPTTASRSPRDEPM